MEQTTASNPEQKQKISGRWKLLAVLAVCAAPMIFSYLTYYVIKPQARTNFGTLIDPRAHPIPPALGATTLDAKPASLEQYKGKWVLLKVGPSTCAQDCMEQMFAMQQVRSMTGKEMDRVERVWLVTTSAKLLKAVGRELTRQTARLSRHEFIAKALAQNGWMILVKDLAAATRLVNQLAPEHCEVMVRNARRVSADIVTAGAIFLGNDSPTVLGDYVAGPSHTLPTGGAGASFAGLTVDQFQRRTSVVEYGKPAVRKALKAVQKFAALEGLDAHGRSAEVRLKKR